MKVSSLLIAGYIALTGVAIIFDKASLPNGSELNLLILSNDQTFPLDIQEVSGHFDPLSHQLRMSRHYRGKLTAVDDSWLRLSQLGDNLYGLAGIGQQVFYIEQVAQQDSLPRHIYAHTSIPSDLYSQAGGPPVSGDDDTAEIDELLVSTQILSLQTIDDAQMVPAESNQDPPRILNVEFIFDPGIIIQRGHEQVEKTLAAANLLSGYYESQANLVINLSALHFPSVTDNPVTGTGQAFEIISDMANDRVSGDLNVASDSIAVFITSRPIMSQAGPHNGFAMLNAACTTAGNTVISDRIVAPGAFGGPPILNAPLNFLYLVEILAHEIGHILGGTHTSCGMEGGIMSTFFDSSPRNHFSSCSLDQFEAYLSTAGECVLDYQPVVAGFDGTWFDISHDGEGLQIQVLSQDRALVAWYTYDQSGNQRWFSGIGIIQGNRIVIEQLTIASGAQFGEDFDPAAVVREPWGSGIISFNDCDNAILTYIEDATGMAGSQTLSRLTSLNGMTCGGLVTSEQAEGFDASGTWFDPSHDGEGLIVEQLNASTLVFSWFSYDDTGEQAWFTGIAVLQEDGSYLSESVSITSGGIFGPEFDPDLVERMTWGNLRLSFSDCDNALLEYQSGLSGFGIGRQNLTRLSTPSGTTCQFPASTH